MQSSGIVLTANNNTAAATAAVSLSTGGRHVLIINAGTYPTTCQLQVQGPSNAWINLGSNITADQVTPLDLPPGQYRLNMSGGSTGSLFANLVRVAY